MAQLSLSPKHYLDIRKKPMTLKETIDQDLKSAILGRDLKKADTLRLLKSAIKNEEINIGEELNDQKVEVIVAKEVKKRQESIVEYKKGNRAELAESEQKEIEILEKYLPEQLSDEELEEIVSEAISKTKASSMQDMGKVMSFVMPQVSGKADGAKVSQIVKEKLLP